VQYVSPQVWAWRRSRARTIGESVDLILCLFPFEPDFYREYGVRAAFVGHPLADQVPMEVDRGTARSALGIDPAARVLAVLPGSRHGEVERLAEPFAGAAGYIASKAAVIAFAKAVAAEYRDQRVRCNAILPSVIDTPANRAAMPDADFSKWVPPEEIGRVVRFLVSDESKPTSGAAVPVYGRA